MQILTDFLLAGTPPVHVVPLSLSAQNYRVDTITGFAFVRGRLPVGCRLVPVGGQV